MTNRSEHYIATTSTSSGQKPPGSMAPMFSSNTLPLPSPFAREHRPLQLTSEAPRALPTGECKFVLPALHASSQNHQCACQSFHLNRNAPGNICDCGHKACYHVHETVTEHQPYSDTLESILDKVNALTEKYKRMEETIQSERGIRETAFQRERRLWEAEVRVVREALAPFYSREKDMRRKLVDIEDRLEGNYDEQVRLRDRVIVIDEAAMSMERRVEELEGKRCKRKRVHQTPTLDEPMLNGHPRMPSESNGISTSTSTSTSTSISSNSSAERMASRADERSVHTPSSRALSPNGVATVTPEVDEPRSSGILNLVELPRSANFNMHPRRSPTHEEARSSGFLTLDMTNAMAIKIQADRHREVIRQATLTPPQDKPSPPSYARSNPEVPLFSTTPPELEPAGKPSVTDAKAFPISMSPRKRKHQNDHIALDVLADVSVASPQIH